MPTIQDFCDALDRICPRQLAEDWDNVGLLAGDPSVTVQRVMTCLTITPESAAEAIEQACQLIVSHHPLPFRPIQRITTDQTPTRLLWELIRAGVAIYSPHTGFDSAAQGINQQLARILGLDSAQPIEPFEDAGDDKPAGDLTGLGGGRWGAFPEPQSVDLIADRLKQSLGLGSIRLVGNADHPVQRIAIACGSGGSFLRRAARLGCDGFVTGETDFHTCLAARADGIALFLLGHYASERFAVERLATELQQRFPTANIWASNNESDPIVSR